MSKPDRKESDFYLDLTTFLLGRKIPLIKILKIEEKIEEILKEKKGRKEKAILSRYETR